MQTVAPETATPQQYASIITRNGDLKKSLAKMVDCDWLSTGRLDYEPGSFTCQFGALSMSYQAMTLQASLEGANSPTATAYVGPPLTSSRRSSRRHRRMLNAWARWPPAPTTPGVESLVPVAARRCGGRPCGR